MWRGPFRLHFAVLQAPLEVAPNSEMCNQCVTHLLPDEPTTHDIFGSHERVASAIGELISSETAGKTIAVTGPWGSGKSSVLRMVRERLGDANLHSLALYAINTTSPR
jgi:ABC-type transport system involved in cytochrome bd biosynthesis fused ATPase/permease subunit